MNFNTIEDIEQAFPDEESARKYLANLRWGKFAKCPHCGNEKAYFIEKGARFKCANPECRKKFSVTVKTLLEETRLPLNKWIYVIFHYAKTRGRCSSNDIVSSYSISSKTEFFIRERLDFAWQGVDRVNKTNVEIFESLVKSCFNCYETFYAIKNAPFCQNPYHLPRIDDISDKAQYSLLLRYTNYYISVYCKWIFMNFGSAQDVLSETFIWMQENGIKEYNTETILKYIWRTVNRMWADFIAKHHKYNDIYRLKNKEFKRISRENISTYYIVSLIKERNGWRERSTKEIRKQVQLLNKVRGEIKERRLSKLKENMEFYSHFD